MSNIIDLNNMLVSAIHFVPMDAYMGGSR